MREDILVLKSHIRLENDNRCFICGEKGHCLCVTPKDPKKHYVELKYKDYLKKDDFVLTHKKACNRVFRDIQEKIAYDKEHNEAKEYNIFGILRLVQAITTRFPI
jgi:hypothetical protein